MHYGFIGGISSTDPHYAEVKRRFEENQKKQAATSKQPKRTAPAVTKKVAPATVQARGKSHLLTAEEERIYNNILAEYNQRAAKRWNIKYVPGVEIR